MEISVLKALLKNISCFFRLSSSENVNFEPFQKYYEKIEEILKLIKPVLDAIVVSEIASEITSDELLQKAFSGLSQSVDELRELFENWHPLMSKVYFVCFIIDIFFSFFFLQIFFESSVLLVTDLIEPKNS